MSPSLTRRLSVHLSPAAVVLRQSERGWRPISVVRATLAVAPGEGGAGWEPAVAALRDWLAANPSARNIDVVVSDHFIRYALLPWSAQVTRADERAMYATIQFEALFGATMAGWVIVTDMGDYGVAGIGCAVQRKLIDALDEVCVGRSLRLASMQPYFMTAYNRWRDQIGSDALFAVIDSGRCLVACRKQGKWHSIRTLRLGAGESQDAAALLEREKLLQGLDAKIGVFVHGLSAGDLAIAGQIAGAKVLALTTGGKQ